MQQASEGKKLRELQKEIDDNLNYGGARKISQFEAQLLDQIDESYDTQLKNRVYLESAKNDTMKVRERLEKTFDAINMYCTDTTQNKISLYVDGYQYFSPEEAQKAEKALSDKEIIMNMEKMNGKITMESVVKNALNNGVTFEDVNKSDYAEQLQTSTTKEDFRKGF